MLYAKDLLQYHNALVTGASRGIGRSIALALGKLGATVIATGTRADSVASIDAMLTEQQIKGQAMLLDVADPDSIEELLTKMKGYYGMPDILVNNAGITQDNLLVRMKYEQWDAIIQTNLTSVYRLSKGCLPSMMKKRWGRMITISSVAAAIGIVGQTNYAAAKAGLIGFSKSLAKEVATRNITVNVIAPGFIESDMTGVLEEDYQQQILEQIPMNRIGQPEDIAQLVVFLASSAGDYITGQTLHVNGGLYMG